MAHIYRLASGLWRAQIRRRGIRESHTTNTKGAAQAWAARREAEILDGSASRWPGKTLAQAIDRYERDITPGKGAATSERVVFGLMRRVDVMTLARISGHRDLRQLIATYYRESAREIAARL
jgi:hypothetical protein